MRISARLRTVQPKSDSDNRKREDQHSRHQNLRARFFRTFATLECLEIPMHFRGRGVSLSRIVRARVHEHVVELQETFAVRSRAQLRIDLREIEPVFSGAGFVKKFAQTVNVGAWCAWAFRRHVTLRSYERALPTRCH